MCSMAAPNNSGDTKSPESEKSAPRSTAAFGAIRTLRVLLVGTIIVPLLLAAIGGEFSYHARYRPAAAGPRPARWPRPRQTDETPEPLAPPARGRAPRSI